MTIEILAEADAADGRRCVELVTDENTGSRSLRISGCRAHVPVSSAWSRADIGKFADWLVHRNEPMRDTVFELLKELGSNHVQ